jgi:6-phosphogluconolactonase/glucosamine-6-phosphate isomerase/deaminase
MNIRKVDSIQPAVDFITESLISHLDKGEEVLWLLTGGSGIQIEVAVSQKLANHDLKNLTVILTDERFPYRQSDTELFDPVNHPNSNWRQIIDAGFSLKGATLIPILKGKDIIETKGEFEKTLSNLLLLTSSYKIGLFGMGADSHTAGILPECPATQEKIHFVSSYDAAEFLRITMTFAAIRKLDEVVLCAFGETKKEALINLRDKDAPLGEQPVQILKTVPKLTIFNDQIGEEV